MGEKSIDTYALTLVRAHYDDEMSFEKSVRELAAHYDAQGRTDLCEYCMTYLPGTPTFSTMEVDPLPNIARDMYYELERELGADVDSVKELRVRLASYFPDFFDRCVNEGLIRTFGRPQ